MCQRPDDPHSIVNSPVFLFVSFSKIHTKSPHYYPTDPTQSRPTELPLHSVISSSLSLKEMNRVRHLPHNEPTQLSISAIDGPPEYLWSDWRARTPSSNPDIAIDGPGNGPIDWHVQYMAALRQAKSLFITTTKKYITLK